MNEKDLFLKKFEDKLRERLDDKTLNSLGGNLDEDFGTSDYMNFRLESLPKSLNLFERAANFSQKFENKLDLGTPRSTRMASRSFEDYFAAGINL